MGNEADMLQWMNGNKLTLVVIALLLLLIICLIICIYYCIKLWEAYQLDFIDHGTEQQQQQDLEANVIRSTDNRWSGQVTTMQVVSCPYNPLSTTSLVVAEEEEEGKRHCSICLEELMVGEPVGLLAWCNHVFHRDCIHRWLRDFAATCPICRAFAFAA